MQSIAIRSEQLNDALIKMERDGMRFVFALFNPSKEIPNNLIVLFEDARKTVPAATEEPEYQAGEEIEEALTLHIRVKTADEVFPTFTDGYTVIKNDTLSIYAKNGELLSTELIREGDEITISPYYITQ